MGPCLPSCCSTGGPDPTLSAVLLCSGRSRAPAGDPDMSFPPLRPWPQELPWAFGLEDSAVSVSSQKGCVELEGSATT